jgi:hypothetical protein
MKAIGWKFVIHDIPKFADKIGLSMRTFQRARRLLINTGKLIENRINRDAFEFFLVGDDDQSIAQNDTPIAVNDQSIAQNDTPIAVTSSKPAPIAECKDSSDLLSDPLLNDYSLEQQREERKRETKEPESLITRKKPESLAVPKIAHDDKFSAAPRISSIKDFPIGPWGQNLFSIHPGFMAVMIAKWRKGNSARSQAFGYMVDEEVGGCIQKYWRKDWENLLIDWNEYEASTRRSIENIQFRQAQGIEIRPEEQKILSDRIMGPELGSTNFVPKIQQTPEEKEHMKAAIEAARKSLHIGPALRDVGGRL